MGDAYSKEVTSAFFTLQGPDVRDCVICDPGDDPLGADLLSVDPQTYYGGEACFTYDGTCAGLIEEMLRQEGPFSGHKLEFAVMCSVVPSVLRERALDQIRSGGDRLPVRRRR